MVENKEMRVRTDWTSVLSSPNAKSFLSLAPHPSPLRSSVVAQAASSANGNDAIDHRGDGLMEGKRYGENDLSGIDMEMDLYIFWMCKSGLMLDKCTCINLSFSDARRMISLLYHS